VSGAGDRARDFARAARSNCQPPDPARASSRPRFTAPLAPFPNPSTHQEYVVTSRWGEGVKARVDLATDKHPLLRLNNFSLYPPYPI